MDICVWDKCNNNCSMCTNPDKPWLSFDGKSEGSYEYEVLVERIKRFKSKAASDDSIILTGGEPTLHPRFLDVLKFIRKTFPKQEIRILTNGRRFVYRDFAEAVLKTDNLNLAVSLYGPTSKIHDAITRTKNSFEQTVGGLNNILARRGADQSVEIRTVISKLSYRYLDQILSLIKVYFPSVDRVILIFIEREGQAIKHSKSVSLSYSQVGPYLEKIYLFFSLLKEVRLYHFPLCSLDSKFWPFVWRTLPEKEVTFIPSCIQCQYKKYCLGIHKDYPNKIKSKEFKSIESNFIVKETNDFYHPIIKVTKNNDF